MKKRLNESKGTDSQALKSSVHHFLWVLRPVCERFDVVFMGLVDSSTLFIQYTHVWLRRFTKMNSLCILWDCTQFYMLWRRLCRLKHIIWNDVLCVMSKLMGFIQIIIMFYFLWLVLLYKWELTGTWHEYCCHGYLPFNEPCALM